MTTMKVFAKRHGEELTTLGGLLVVRDLRKCGGRPPRPALEADIDALTKKIVNAMKAEGVVLD